MNLGAKQGLDALLKDWPAPLPAHGTASPDDEERSWDARANTIVAAATKAERASGGALDALLAAPALAPEPGESGVVFLSGEKRMSDEKVEDAHGISSPPAAPTPVTMGETPKPPAQPERKRTSLKEIAARASQSGGRPSIPAGPASVPPASSTGRASSPSIPGARPSVATPIPRPVEAGKEDSGVINLAVVNATVTAQQVAAAEKAKPAQAGLFEDEKTVESAVNPAERVVAKAAPAVAVVAAPKKSSAGPIAGVAIAVLGIAAAYMIVARKPAPNATVATEARHEAPAASAPAPAPTIAAAPKPTVEATAIAASDLPPSTTAEAEAKGAEPSKHVAVATGPAAGGPAPSAKEDAKTPPTGATAAAAAAAAGKPGDLQSEMAKAVGPIDKGQEGAPSPEPVAAASRNQNVPEQPSQGSVQAAMGAVLSGAKACVAGADDVSRAMVTFSSSGSVSSVSVTGWAAAHGKSGCIQGALKGAKVGPFSKPSFTFPVTIRP